MVVIAMGTVLSAAKGVYNVSQKEEVMDFLSLLCCNSPFADLNDMINAAQISLLLAENQQLNILEADHVERIRRAVYDADDLFDKFFTQQRQLLLMKGCHREKLCRFFSWDNLLWVAADTFLRYQKIKQNFDDIRNFSVDDISATLSAKVEKRPFQKEETASHVNQGDVIGRDEDVNKIVASLLKPPTSSSSSSSFSSSSSSSNGDGSGVSFLSIVGVGGMGKTAVAKLVYNNIKDKQKAAFPLPLWACVSDHDITQPLNVAQILGRIISSATQEAVNVSILEVLQTKATQELQKKRFMLVLDDVWTEDKSKWDNLASCLSAGYPGSWVVVTTRSHKTAEMIGVLKYELRGLSMPDSWCLLKKIAGVPKRNEESFKHLGEKILQRCDKTPLTIRVIGGILKSNKELSQWSSLLKEELPKSEESLELLGANNIISFSYRQLETQVKICFIYCALFPKGYVLKKAVLLDLWMAQGYITPSEEDSQTAEDVGDAFFLTLVNRSFFYEVKYDDMSGRITTFMIHDVLNDFARKEAGLDICVTKFPTPNMDLKVRHLAYTSPEFGATSFEKTHIRSYHYVGTHVNPLMDASHLEALFLNWTCLRALDFFMVNIESLPESIGGLLHLRLLNLLNNRSLKVLPKSITKLYNLETLKIGGCLDLKELPSEFTRLVKLRNLEIIYCGINQVIVLPQLNSLRLEWLPNLEYIIDFRPKTSTLACLEYPSMRNLDLWKTEKLTGWGYSRVEEGEGSDKDTPTLFLPELNSLGLSECPQMKWKLQCPKLKHVRLEECNEDMTISQEAVMEEQGEGSSSSSSSWTPLLHTSLSFGNPFENYYLTSIVIDNMSRLENIPKASFLHLRKLEIDGDQQIKSLVEADRVFHGCSSSLESFCIRRCNKLTHVMSRGLEHLTNLEILRIESCSRLSLSDEAEELERWQGLGRDMRCPSFCPTLRQLKFYGLQKLRFVPNWVQFLTALETFEIKRCPNVETNPAWIPKLPSLKKIDLLY